MQQKWWNIIKCKCILWNPSSTFWRKQIQKLDNKNTKTKKIKNKRTTKKKSPKLKLRRRMRRTPKLLSCVSLWINMVSYPCFSHFIFLFLQNWCLSLTCTRLNMADPDPSLHHFLVSKLIKNNPCVRDPNPNTLKTV